MEKEEVAIANLILGKTANEDHCASRLKVQTLQQLHGSCIFIYNSCSIFTWKLANAI